VRIVADFYYYVLKREGLGLGDGKLLAMIGAVMGWRSIPVVLFGASVVGSAIAIPLLLLSRKRGDEVAFGRVQVPFGPFLALGALIYLFAGRSIWAVLIPSG
jgi:leader peptidase (prepilin peptidase)/N-methyltransferase